MDQEIICDKLIDPNNDAITKEQLSWCSPSFFEKEPLQPGDADAGGTSSKGANEEHFVATVSSY